MHTYPVQDLQRMHRAQFQNNTVITSEYGPMWTSTTFLLPSSWHTSRARSFTTVDTLTYSSRPIVVKRLRLDLSDEDKVRATVLSVSDCWLESLVGPEKHLRYYSTGGGNLYVMGVSDRSGVFIHYSAVEDDTGEEKWKAVKCVNIVHGVHDSSLLCPYSGRFAYVCATPHSDNSNRIHVIDLLDE